MWSEIQLKGDRMERRGDQGKRTNVEGIKRERVEEGGRRRVWGKREEGLLAFLRTPSCPGFFGQGEGQQRGKEGGRVEERRGMEPRGGASVAFVCFPRFKASLEKWIDRGKSIAWPSQREREREIERAGEEGRGGVEGGERQIMEGRSKRIRKAQGGESKMTHDVHSHSVCVCVCVRAYLLSAFKD